MKLQVSRTELAGASTGPVASPVVNTPSAAGHFKVLCLYFYALKAR